MTRLLLASAAILLTATACGDDDAFDRTDANAVYVRTMRAVHAADWKVLREMLTRDAARTLERDVTRLQRRLGHPDDGKREREIAAARLGEGADEAVRKAAEGTLSDALRFFLLLSPREAVPPRKGLQAEERKMRMLYELGDGTLKAVGLVRRSGGWYVDDLQL